MRRKGKNGHNGQLLHPKGRNSAPVPDICEKDVINIPEEMISKDLINVIVGNLQEISTEYLSKGVIVLTSNEETLDMDSKNINLIPGEVQIYNSADSVVSKDINNTINFTIKIFNT